MKNRNLLLQIILVTLLPITAFAETLVASCNEFDGYDISINRQNIGFDSYRERLKMLAKPMGTHRFEINLKAKTAKLTGTHVALLTRPSKSSVKVINNGTAVILPIIYASKTIVVHVPTENTAIAPSDETYTAFLFPEQGYGLINMIRNQHKNSSDTVLMPGTVNSGRALSCSFQKKM